MDKDKLWEVLGYVGLGLTLIGALVKGVSSAKSTEKNIDKSVNKYLDRYLADEK